MKKTKDYILTPLSESLNDTIGADIPPPENEVFEVPKCKIILNRPEKRNSMTTDFWKEFPEIVSDINQEGIIRVIIISSTGPHFCSGLDLSIFQSDLLDINKEKANKAILLNNYI